MQFKRKHHKCWKRCFGEHFIVLSYVETLMVVMGRSIPLEHTYTLNKAFSQIKTC